MPRPSREDVKASREEMLARVLSPVPLLSPRHEWGFRPEDIEWGIGELRGQETILRRARRRLEALRDGCTGTCPQCGNPLAARADAVYCSSACRVRAHRDHRAHLRGNG
jgi:hypothetical protein